MERRIVLPSEKSPIGAIGLQADNGAPVSEAGGAWSKSVGVDADPPKRALVSLLYAKARSCT